VPDDIISPLPDAFEWDIDHGDVARETPRDWLAEPCPGIVATCSIGTSVGADVADRREGPPVRPFDPSQCDDGLNGGSGGEDANVDPRIDYIVLRPQAPPDVTRTRTPVYLVSREAPAADVWTSVWPAVVDTPGSCETPPARLSDHRMGVAEIGIVPLRVPPRYHPFFDHDVQFRVVSYNATDQSDCIFDLCGPVDAFSRIDGRRLTTAGITETVAGTPHFTPQCEGYAGSFQEDTCMSTWALADRHQPLAGHLDFTGAARLFDADSTSPRDFFDVMEPGTTPAMTMTWATGLVIVTQDGDTSTVPRGWMDFRVANNDSVPFCTRDGRPTEICIELSFEENP
jgi:hypothetical protein